MKRGYYLIKDCYGEYIAYWDGSTGEVFPYNMKIIKWIKQEVHWTSVGEWTGVEYKSIVREVTEDELILELLG